VSGEPWRENEDGPDCACGEPTVVKLLPDGTAVLLCFFHTGEAGAYTRLPAERPVTALGAAAVSGGEVQELR
jgi:hypothetical protein